MGLLYIKVYNVWDTYTLVFTVCIILNIEWSVGCVGTTFVLMHWETWMLIDCADEVYGWEREWFTGLFRPLSWRVLCALIYIYIYRCSLSCSPLLHQVNAKHTYLTSIKYLLDILWACLNLSIHKSCSILKKLTKKEEEELTQLPSWF